MVFGNWLTGAERPTAMAGRRLALATVVGIAAVAIAACGDNADDADPGETVASTTATVAPVTTSEPDPTGAPATGPPSTEQTTRPTFEPASTQPELVGSTAPAGPSATPAPIGEQASTNLMAAVADLAGRVGADPTTILVVSEENVTWRDSSIGCPEPGVGYLQSLVDGVRIVLEADGVRYAYHAGGARPIFYCADPQVPGD